MEMIDAIQKGGYECLKSFLENKGYKREFVRYDASVGYIKEEKMNHIRERCRVGGNHALYSGLIEIESVEPHIEWEYDKNGFLNDKYRYPFNSIAEDYFILETFSLFDKNYSTQNQIDANIYERYYYKIDIIRKDNTVIELVLYKYLSDRDKNGYGGNRRTIGLLFNDDSKAFMRSLIQNKKNIPTHDYINLAFRSESEKKIIDKINLEMGSDDWMKYISFNVNNFSCEMDYDINSYLELSIDYIHIVDEKLRELEIADYYKKSKQVAELTGREIISEIGFM